MKLELKESFEKFSWSCPSRKLVDRGNTGWHLCDRNKTKQLCELSVCPRVSPIKRTRYTMARKAS